MGPSTLTHFECARTGARYDADRLLTLSDAGAPLLARYDLERAAIILRPEHMATRRRPLATPVVRWPLTQPPQVLNRLY